MSTEAQVRAFRKRLLRWYARYQRPLPWRKTRDPYRILVSEIMLQQTQVDRVIPKYHEFLRRYPTVQKLARARDGDVRKVWYPLGYNVRPIRLRNIARRVVKQHAGKIPDSYDGLMAMDGIGRYTAGAVLSFAFNQDAPILDTNVARLLQRYFRVKANPSTKRTLWELAGRVIPPGQAYGINQAMMDFGAMICTARKPGCASCALRRDCRSYPVSEQLPTVRVAVAVIERRGRYLISQRHPGGHLGNYWEFPGGKRRVGETWTACLRRELREELGVRVRPLTQMEPIRFRYPDRVVYLAVFACAMTGRPAVRDCQQFRWVRGADLRQYRFPPADARLIQRLSAPTQLRRPRRRATIPVQ